ncbi:hypothetical protein E2562_005608 [Oryza meyeriana var. granulata]|uniref:FBD domain-containing protein n=1 Tax=Oryza meyeriana var. granulata TaxID=110450 RepID=A0A6G1F461_9ORYZ|nr:hypothetical protein E2562_005608 [Oryza meyeriana var. granulata]
MEEYRAEASLWLHLLAAKGVDQLVFMNRPSSIKTDVRLPATLFRCASVTRLYLGFWRFPDTATLPRATAAFPHLRELGLCTIIMGNADLAFLFDKCPVLENLLIVGGRTFLRVPVAGNSLRCVQVCASIVEEITVVSACNLERLLLWEAWGKGDMVSRGCVINMRCRIKIGHALKLRILGFLVPGMHELEISNTIIKAGTKASPRTTMPSVHMLGVQVKKLGDRKQAGMMPSFLRCFPNIETLYVQSENDDMPNGKLDLKFWQDAGPIECVKRHIKKMVLREFRGQRGELDFLKFIAEHAEVLEQMVVVTTSGSADRLSASLRAFLASAKWASEGCKLMISRSPFHQEGTAWCYQGAFDFSNQDPFDLSSPRKAVSFLGV